MIMKRMLFIAVVTVSVTGFVGTGSVRAEMAMSGASMGGGSSGGTGMGSVGGWSLAPEPLTKKKTTAPSTSGKTAAKSRSPGGGWAMMEADPHVTASKPATGGPASPAHTTVASNTATASPAAARSQKTGEAVRPTREATDH